MKRSKSRLKIFLINVSVLIILFLCFGAVISCLFLVSLVVLVLLAFVGIISLFTKGDVKTKNMAITFKGKNYNE